MDGIITLTLVKSLIMESVKNETYQTGQVDKAINDKNILAAYHEQAGDEAYHLRMLERGLYTNISDLETFLAEYITNNDSTTGDNITSEETGDYIYINLRVGDRFNTSLTDPLAKLCSKYVEENMLADWWKPLNKDKSALYLQYALKDLASIRRCFNKTAPKAPTYKYPTSISTVGSAIDIGVGEECTVTYTISDGAIDDIEIRIEDEHLITAGRSREGFTIIGRQLGHTYIQLYSRHDEQVTQTVHVFVTDQS